MAVCVYMAGFIPVSPIWNLLIQLDVGVVITLIYNEICQRTEYLEIKEIAKSFINRSK